MPAFLPGTELAAALWSEVVAPVVARVLPDQPRAAALIGDGSDVFGFDDLRSTDHGWGPRLTVFLTDDDLQSDGARLAELIDIALPPELHGWPTHFPPGDGAPARPQVRVSSVSRWFRTELGFDPTGLVTLADWLTTPTQKLRAATNGRVFVDDAGALSRARARLAWYPHNVWLHVLACQWRRIDQEEPFPGRCAEVGDELGASVVTARLVRELMRLCFLLERRYAPYAKWVGTAFAELEVAAEVRPELQGALAATDHGTRQAHLVQASQCVARRFNALGLTGFVDPTVAPFHDRPYLVLGSGRFVDACRAVGRLGQLPLTGAIDQVTDNTDVLTNPGRCRELMAGLLDADSQRIAT
ncbi:hypothetical protein BH24ACT3_BH24ACT3_12740 [soil metagenome]